MPPDEKQDRRIEFEIGETCAGMRLDQALALSLQDISRSAAASMIENGRVWVDARDRKASYRVQSGQSVTIDLPDPILLEAVPETIPLDILYEDVSLLVINKPKGMVVHPAPGHPNGTLVNALLDHCRESLSGINGVLRPGILHRIDRDTTGALLVAKTDDAHRRLAEQIETHSVDRIYLGIVCGRPKEESGTVRSLIGRDPNNRKRMSMRVSAGKPAVTHYYLLQSLREGYSLMAFRLETGRTHQIRVHMAGMGMPLLGDEVYGRRKSPYALEGQTLHAALLGFTHPVSGEHMCFFAPLPAYFTGLLEKLGGDVPDPDRLLLLTQDTDGSFWPSAGF